MWVSEGSGESQELTLEKFTFCPPGERGRLQFLKQPLIVPHVVPSVLATTCEDLISSP